MVTLNGRVCFMLIPTDGGEVTSDCYEGWERSQFLMSYSVARQHLPVGSRLDMYRAEYDSEGVQVRCEFVCTLTHPYTEATPTTR
jgi:hypothetical protein